MAHKDLREFIHELERQGELVRVKVEVEKDHEVGAICRKVNDTGGPALLFENVRGYAVPLLCNVLGTRKRFAMALGSTEGDFKKLWLQRTGGPLVDSITVPEGVCQENIILGNDINLLEKFPIPIWNGLDGGPYITLPVVISRDPETGIRNAAMYRMQVHGPNKIGILMAPYRHTDMHRVKAYENNKGLPVAIALGADPVVVMSALAPLPFGVDELAVAGALKGEPVKMVQCKTVDLEVPAAAEIVLEGEILRDERIQEGPYGEFTGYYGTVQKRLVIEVKAVTHRDQPIYQGLYNGRPPTEEHIIRGLPTEIDITQQCPLPGIKELNLTMGGCGAFNCIVSIEKRFEGYGKMIALALLGTWGARFIKTIIVVDDDIDPFDWTQVEWALAIRVQPHRDVEIIKEVVGCALDPSLPLRERQTGSSRTSKMIIDATRYDDADFEIPCSPRADVMAKVIRDWARYGIS
ncbi:MAG: UbiD family decarboxylase [Desulfobacterales bacterium]|nr:UbiD family decarboxylase [Desulfobacterales bacterium]